MALTRERSSCKNAYLERVSFGMFRFCYFCQFSRNGFGCACGSKSAQADIVAMFNQACSFCC